MKALVMKEIGKIAWIDKEKPVCGPNDAIIKPLALAPCTSDIHTVYDGGIGDRHDVTLGHEGVGEVVEVGKMVKDFKIGDKVILSAVVPDWNSIEAQNGHSQHSGGMLGGYKWTNLKDGMFAEFIHVNDADGNLTILPNEVSLEEGCMLSDMVPTGFQAADMADIQFGEVVAIFGIGPVGLMATAATNLRGAGRIIVIDSRQQTADIAREYYGATDYIDFKKGSIVEQVMALTNGKGVDKAIITGGRADVLGTALEIVKAGGIISNINYYSGVDVVPIPVAAWGAGMSGKQIRCDLMKGGRDRTEKLARLVQYKKLDVKPLVTNILHGFDKLEEGLDMMRTKPAGMIKPVVIVK